MRINDAQPANTNVMSADFSYRGDVFATGARDLELRLFDVRSGALAASASKVHRGAKGFSLTYVGAQEKLITAGFGSGGSREVALWDVRALDKGALYRVDFASGSALPVPFYDEDANVVFVAARGETQVRMYEPTDDGLHFLTAYSGGAPAVGLAMLPKRLMDVRAVELARFVKATPNKKVVTLEMTVPRTRTEFFQDDIMSSARAGRAATTGDEWFANAASSAEPPRVDLKPSDMTPLSEAPKIERTGPKYAVKADDESGDAVDAVWARMNAMTGKKSKEDAALERAEGVDEDEWDADGDDAYEPEWGAM